MSTYGTRRGTVGFMDVWLDGGDRSDLYSDEGTVFGKLGMGRWDDVVDDLHSWLIREN